MTHKTLLRNAFAAIAVLGWMTSSAHAQYETERGAALGGIAGAIIGGVAGHQNDETPEGIAIGGAVGAITGGVIGHVQGKAAERERQLQHQQRQMQYQQQQMRSQEVARRAVTFGDVISMTRNGLSDGVIINHIHLNGVQQRLSVNDIIALHQQGVSEMVIQAMQEAPLYSVSNPAPYGNRYVAPTQSFAPQQNYAPQYTSPTATRYRPAPTQAAPSSNYYQNRTYRRRM